MDTGRPAADRDDDDELDSLSGTRDCHRVSLLCRHDSLQRNANQAVRVATQYAPPLSSPRGRPNA